jgi:ABC-type transporter Mla subunit MlaD
MQYLVLGDALAFAAYYKTDSISCAQDVIKLLQMENMTLWRKALATLGLMLFAAGTVVLYFAIYPVNRARSTAHITFPRYTSAHGLDPGSVVLYLGRPVGIVSRVDLCNDQINVVISFNTTFTINTSTYTTLEISDIQFRKTVMVYTPDLDATPLNNTQDVTLELRGAPTSIANLQEEGFAILRKVESILTEIDAMLRDTRPELAHATDKTVQTMDDIRGAAIKLQSALSDISRSRFGRFIGIQAPVLKKPTPRKHVVASTARKVTATTK